MAELTVISPERESGLVARGLSFDDVERGWPLDTEVGLGGRASPAQFGVEVRHAAAAEILGISPTTAKAEWRMARAWLRRRLEG